MDRTIGGRYRLLSTVGRGGMATVYEAEDTRLGRRVAVKVLHPQFSSDQRLRQRFASEAKSVSRIRHANVGVVFDFSGVESHELWIVSEFIDGVTVGQLLAQRRAAFPPQVALAIALESLQALDVAHQEGIVHRDVKSDNLMLSLSGDLKVLDFGIAKDRSRSAFKTQAGLFMGSPSYMSPEQVRGEPVDLRTDLYSLGIVLYEALAGALPFRAESIADLVRLIVERDPARLSGLRSDVSDGLAACIHRMIEKRPAERFASAPETAAALMRCFGKGNLASAVLHAFAQSEHALMRRIASETKQPLPEPGTVTRNTRAVARAPENPATVATPDTTRRQELQATMPAADPQLRMVTAPKVSAAGRVIISPTTGQPPNASAQQGAQPPRSPSMAQTSEPSPRLTIAQPRNVSHQRRDGTTLVPHLRRRPSSRSYSRHQRVFPRSQTRKQSFKQQILAWAVLYVGIIAAAAVIGWLTSPKGWLREMMSRRQQRIEGLPGTETTPHQAPATPRGSGNSSGVNAPGLGTASTTGTGPSGATANGRPSLPPAGGVGAVSSPTPIDRDLGSTEPSRPITVIGEPNMRPTSAPAVTWPANKTRPQPVSRPIAKTPTPLPVPVPFPDGGSVRAPDAGATTTSATVPGPVATPAATQAGAPPTKASFEARGILVIRSQRLPADVVIYSDVGVVAERFTMRTKSRTVRLVRGRYKIALTVGGALTERLVEILPGADDLVFEPIP